MVAHSAINHAGIAGIAGITFARKTADQASTSTSLADVTGLTFAVSASTNYRFRFVVFFVTSAAGEGLGLSVNGPSGTYKLGGLLPAAAPNAAGSAIFHSSGAAADSGFLVATAGPGATSTMAIIEGVALIGGAGGTLALRLKAETGGANSVTVQANSYGEISTF